MYKLDREVMRVFGLKKTSSKPQNVEQGISNVEVNTSLFCGSLIDIRYSRFTVGVLCIRINSQGETPQGQS